MVVNAVKQELRGLRRDVSQNFAWYHWVLIGALLLLMVATAPVSAFSGAGAGTSGDPYQITSISEWSEISSGSDYYKLMNDIDFTGNTFLTRSDATSARIDGNGKTLSNIYQSTTGNIGLFNAFSGTISKVLLSGFRMTSTQAGTNGLFCDNLNGGTATQVFIYNCTFTDVANSGTRGSAFANTGSGGTLLDCGIINMSIYYPDTVGLFTAYSSTSATNLMAANSVITETSSTYRGAFVGYDNGQSRTYCYREDTISVAGGDGAGATALTTAQMKTQGSFTGFDFDSTHWKMSGSGGIYKGYPILYWMTEPAAPVANFTVSTPHAQTYPLTVTCTDTSTNIPTSWAWSWGDGTANSTTANPSHQYTSAGTWTIILTATNALGSSSYTRTNYITTYAPPTVTSMTPTSTYNINTISMTITGTGYRTGESVGIIKDDHSASSSAYNVVVVNATTLTASISVDGLSAGIWELYVTDIDSVVSTSHAHLTILSTLAPTTSFTADAVLGSPSLLVKFTDTSGNAPTSWLWTFGDGAAATNTTTRNPWHTYTTAGVYTVTLVATNAYGSNTAQYVDYITVGLNPVASYTHTADGTQIPLTVVFNSTATQSPTSWEWFEQIPPSAAVNSIATTQNLTRTFYTAGTYIITHTATNAYGRSTLAYSHTITATAIPTPTPTPTPTPSPSDGHAIGTPDPIDFGDTGTVVWNTQNITTATSAVNGLTYTITAWYVDWAFTNFHDGLLYGSSLFPVALPANSAGTFDFVDRIPWYPLYNPNSIFNSTVLSGWNSKNYWEIYAYNASAPEPGHLILYSSTEQNVTFVNPTITATWVGVGTTNPAPSDTITLTYDTHSFSGMGSHPTNKFQLESSIDGGTTWVSVSGYPKVINVTGAEAFSVASARQLRYWITAYGLVAGTDISTTKTLLIVQSATAQPYFKWTDTTGKVISKASDTSTIKFGLSSGTIGENTAYDHLKLQFQKYNDQTDRWDNIAVTPGYIESTTGNHVATSDTSNNHAWVNGFILDGSNSVITYSAFTAPVAGEYRALLYGMTGSTATTLLTSTTLTITKNSMNPSNIANGVGGLFGIDATGGVARYAAGMLICMIIGVIVFFFVRDARVFLVGIAGGTILSFTLGLFDAWILLVIGIIGIVILLFSFGILGTGGGERGGGGSALPSSASNGGSDELGRGGL